VKHTRRIAIDGVEERAANERGFVRRDHLTGAEKPWARACDAIYGVRSIFDRHPRDPRTSTKPVRSRLVIADFVSARETTHVPGCRAWRDEDHLRRPPRVRIVAAIRGWRRILLRRCFGRVARGGRTSVIRISPFRKADRILGRITKR